MLGAGKEALNLICMELLTSREFIACPSSVSSYWLGLLVDIVFAAVWEMVGTNCSGSTLSLFEVSVSSDFVAQSDVEGVSAVEGGIEATAPLSKCRRSAGRCFGLIFCGLIRLQGAFLH